MRETIGSTWIYQLVIVFILIFVSFLILSLSYSKAYKNKNEVIDIIERNEGVNKETVGTINNYLFYNGYRIKNYCPRENGWLGSTDIEKSKALSVANPGTKYYYCVRRRAGSKNMVYYEVKIFFKFNLPIVQNVGTFTIDGSTNDIMKTKDWFDDLKIGSV